MDPSILTTLIVAVVGGGGLVWGWLQAENVRKQIQQVADEEIEELHDHIARLAKDQLGRYAPVVREQKWPLYWTASWGPAEDVDDGPSADA